MSQTNLLRKLIMVVFGPAMACAAFFTFGAWFSYDAFTGQANWSAAELALVAILFLVQSYAVWVVLYWGGKVFFYAQFTKSRPPRLRDFARMVPVCIRTRRSVTLPILLALGFLGVYLLRERWVGFEVGLAIFASAILVSILFEIWPPYAVVLGRSSDETVQLFFDVYRGLYPLKITACIDYGGEGEEIVLMRYRYRTFNRYWKKQIDGLLSACQVAILDGRDRSDAVSYEIGVMAQKRCCPIIVTRNDGSCPALTKTAEFDLRSKNVEFDTVADLISQFRPLNWAEEQ